tara:strand:- start:2298 stop:2657 length:360 start_codon:yes stop_codon:yes gene_type:complete
MSDVYKNRSVVLANTNKTTIYTVPTADVSTTPVQKPVQALVRSIRICNVSGGAVTADVVNTDASVGSDINITSVLSIAANTATEILSQPLVLEDSDIIKVTAGSGGALHVIVSVLEISE